VDGSGVVVAANRSHLSHFALDPEGVKNELRQHVK
jgi:hypothetical protein